MTQPVQEPLTQRSISQLTWGQNQLYRRPSLAGGDDRPWIRVSKPFVDGTFYPNQTIANNSNVDIDWDEVYNIGAGESGEGIFSTGGGPPINFIVFEVQGLYAITAEVYWNEAGTFPWNMNFSGDGSNWFHAVHTGYYDSLGGFEAMGTMTMIHRYEAGTQLHCHVYQRSGGNRTIIAAYMEAVYMGSWTGVEFDGILPDQ